MMGRIQKLSLYLLVPIALLVLVTVLSLYWIVGTTAGTHWAVRTATASMAPKLIIGDIRGELWSGVEVKNMRYAQPGFVVEIGAAIGEWDLLSVLGGQFQLKNLVADNLLITVLPATKEPEPTAWPSLSVPFPIAVNNLSIRNARLQQPDSSPIDLGDLTFRGQINPLQYQLQELRLTSPSGSLVVNGKLSSSFPYRHSLVFNWGFDNNNQQYAGKGTLTGTLGKTEVVHETLGPVVIQSAGTFGLNNQAGLVAAELPLLQFDLNHQWTKIPLALADLPVMLKGQLSHKGTGEDFSIAAETVVEPVTDNDIEPVFTLLPDQQVAKYSQQILPTTLHLDADGSLSGLHIHQAMVQSATGSANASGDVNWREGFSWDLQATAEDLNLAVVLPDWPAVISGPLSSKGFVAGDHYDIAINSDGLKGTIRDFPFEVQLSSSLQPQTINIQSLEAAVAENRLSAHGTVDWSAGSGTAAKSSGPGKTSATNDFTWELNAPYLEALGPEIAGSITSKGRLQGTFENPLVSAIVTGSNLSFQQWSLRDANANLQSASNRHLSIDAQLEDLTGPGLTALDVVATAEGRLDQHQLRLQFSNTDFQAEVFAEGQYQVLSWTGTLQDSSLTTRYAETWQQTGSTAARLTASRRSIEEFCLTQQSAKLCLQADLEGEDANASMRLTNLPLAKLKPWLPEATEVSGIIDGQLNVDTDTNGLTGKLRLSTTDAEFSYATDSDNRQHHPANIEINGNLDQGNVELKGLITIRDIARMTVNLDTQLNAARSLSGNATITVDDLQWLDAFTNQLEAPTGEVHGSFAVAGTFDAPTIEGVLSLSAFSTKLPATGVALTQGDVRVQVDKNGPWALLGTVHTEDGEATLSGTGTVAELLQGNIALGLKGENLALINLPDTKLRVSPDIQLHIDQERSALTGNLHIPSANIILNQLAQGAISTSKDEIIRPPLTKEKTSTNFTARLAIGLGDKVRVRGYGLDTYLNGDMTLRRTLAGANNARGQIHLRKGTFEAYGQKLKITRGTLIFQGNLENPGVNILAVRETSEAEVGLRITGVLKDFETDIFSDPALPPTDATVLLVTGKLPKDINEAEANLVVNTAAALGIAQSDRITSQLQNAFGFDVLSLEGGDTYEESSLVVGKQLTPKLFVSYVQNLFSPSSSFILQYQFNDNLGLKAESGESQSIDVLYRIEH